MLGAVFFAFTQKVNQVTFGDLTAIESGQYAF
jgi:hypothetical protein